MSGLRPGGCSWLPSAARLPVSQSGSFIRNCWWHLIKVRSGWRHSGFVELNRRIWFCSWAQMLSFWNCADHRWGLLSVPLIDCFCLATVQPALIVDTRFSVFSVIQLQIKPEPDPNSAVLVSSFYDVINIEITGLILGNEPLGGFQLNLPKYFDLRVKKITSKWTFLQIDSLSVL